MRLRHHTRGHTPAQLPWRPLARPCGRCGRPLRLLRPSQPPARLHSRRLRPLRSWQRQPWRQRSVDALSSSPTPPVAVLLASRSMVVTVGGLCLILGQQGALLAVETRLWRRVKSASKA